MLYGGWRLKVEGISGMVMTSDKPQVLPGFTTTFTTRFTNVKIILILKPFYIVCI